MAFFESDIVQDEAKRLFGDYQQLMQLGSEYGKFDREGKKKFIEHGLWRYTRHPNYFGEILLWIGLYVACSAVFRGWQYLTVASPIFVMLLITRLSGVPLLEASGLKRWGGSAEYQRYIRDVPVLIPFIKT